MRLPEKDRDVHLLAVIVLYVLGFAVYFNSFAVPFVFDDYPNIRDNPSIRLTSLAPDELIAAGFESHASRRPIANMSFAINYLIGGYDVKGYHLVNVLVHVANGVLVYFLSLLFLKRDPSLAASATDRRLHFAALLAGAVFVVHPVQVQAVTYIVQRMTSMATMFYLLSLLLYLIGRGAHTGPRRASLWAGAAIAWVLALGSKEIALTLPAMICIVEWLFFRDRARHAIGVSPWLVATAVVATLGACALYLGGDPLTALMSQYEDREFSPSERMMTELRVVVYYLGLVAFPAPARLSLEHAFTVSRSLVDPVTTLACAVAILGLLAAALAFARRRPVASLAILWFFVTLSVESTFVGLELAFEHRLYLPMFAIALAVGYLASLVPSRYAVSAAVGGIALVASLGVSTIARNAVWQDPVRLWADTAAKAPESHRARNNLGRVLLDRGDTDGAAAAFTEAIRIKPDYAEPHNNLGTIHARAGRLGIAMEAFATAIVADPDYAQAYNNLGAALLRAGRPYDAAIQLRSAITKRPGYARAHANMARALERLGRAEDACRQLTIALELDDSLRGLEAERERCDLISKPD